MTPPANSSPGQGNFRVESATRLRLDLTMLTHRPFWPALALIFAGAVCLAQNREGGGFRAAFPDDSLYLAGRHVYERHCLVCHGERGDGRGEMAKEMFPKPRPFKDGVFKYSTTPAGKLPTNDDLRRVIRQGISGTSMPVFDKLSDGEVRAVIEYVKAFSPRWRKPENYAPPLEVPEPPGWFDDETVLRQRAAKGGEMFAAACASCHGDKGEGNGPAAASLKDAWEQPAPPADLRRGGLRNGTEHRDLQRVMMKGIDGTPMAAFQEALTEEQRWELVAFIQQLRREHEAERGRR